MKGGYTQRWVSPRAILGVVFVLATLICGVFTPRANAAVASQRTADNPPPITVTYHLAAVMVKGNSAGSTVTGQVTGTLDYTNALTATLTTTTGITATVTGALTSTTNLTSTSLKVKSKTWGWTLSGKLVNSKAGQFGGAIAAGATSGAGSWVLIPETIPVGFDLGGMSAKTSTHKVSVGGALSLMTTADGWADGTFTLLTNGKIVPAYGQVANGNLAVTIALPQGDVLAVGTSHPFLQLTKWTGTFAGPGTGDTGSWSGEG
jgi:hypothetical protein